MGYYTRYSLKVDDDNYGMVDHIKGISEESGYDNPFEEPCKWYDHEKDMMEWSKKNKGILFTLTGEGEEGGDLWIKYFKNGKVQVCKGEITYPPFDESKLK